METLSTDINESREMTIMAACIIWYIRGIRMCGILMTWHSVITGTLYRNRDFQ